jgi:hypothetical protein
MNNEQKELLDEVYENYVKSFFKGELKENYEGGGYDFDDYYYSIIDVQNLLGWPNDGPISQEEFITKCKTNTEFSEKWGLKIEERELSLVDRTKILVSKSDNKKDFYDRNERLIVEEHTLVLDEANIPTKLITITYKDKTIESYE